VLETTLRLGVLVAINTATKPQRHQESTDLTAPFTFHV